MDLEETRAEARRITGAACDGASLHGQMTPWLAGLKLGCIVIDLLSEMLIEMRAGRKPGPGRPPKNADS